MKGDGSRPDQNTLAEHRGFVEALARRLVFDRHLADDVAQEALLAALRNPPRERGALRGWLARVVRNLAFRSLRTRERRGRRERRAARPEATPATADLVARLTWHRKVVETLLELPEPYRETLLLRFYEDLEPKQITERQGVPGGTVRSRLKRGLAIMRDRLDAEHGGSRRAWTLGLIPLLFPAPPAAAATGGVFWGVAAMSAQKKTIMAAVLLLALAGTFLAGRRALRSGEEAARVPGRVTASAVPAPEGGETEASKPVPAGSVLVVFVKDRSGAPIAGARVEVLRSVPFPDGGPWLPNDIPIRRWIARSQGEEVLAAGSTDAAGRAAIRGAPGTGFDIRASHPGYAIVSRNLWRAPEEPVTLVLTPAYLLRGRVVDQDGAPVAGALVFAGDTDPQGRLGASDPPVRVRADAEGRYEFRALPGKNRGLWAAFPGGTAVYVAAIRFPAVDRFDIRLERGGVLTGTISESGTGAPLSDVSVTVAERGLPVQFCGHAVTGRDGRYRIDTMPPGFIGSITLEKQGYAQVYERPGEGVELRRGREAVLDGRMYRGGVIRGTVEGPGGPVPGISVATIHQVKLGGLVVRNASTDKQGRFEFDSLPEGTHVLGAMSKRFEVRDALDSPWQAADRKHPLIVQLGRGATVERKIHLTRGDMLVEGIVVGPDGRPVPDVEVASLGASTQTGPDGAFRLEGVRARPKAVIWVHAKGLAIDGPQPKLDPEPKQVTGVRIRLKPADAAPVLSGVVRDQSGALPRDCEVLVARLPDESLPAQVAYTAKLRMWQRAARVAAGADGRFELRLPEGTRLLVRATAQGRAPGAPVGVTREPGKAHYEVELVLEAGHTLAGTTLPGAHVSVHPPMQGMDKYYASMSGVVPPTVDAVADDEGLFGVAQLAAGRWEVTVRVRGHADVSALVDLPQTRALRLVPEPKVAMGGVVVYEDGAPAVGAKVHAWELEEDGRRTIGQGAQYGVRTGADGSWSLEGLRPGRFRLNVRGNPKANLVRHSDTSVRGGQTDLRIVVRRGLSVSGKVIDAAGEGVAGVYLHIARREGNVLRSYGEDTSAENGAFHLVGVLRGVHDLHLRKGKKKFVVKGVRGGTEGLRITFDPARDDLGRTDVRGLSGVLLDERGRPMAGRTLRLERSDGGAMSSRKAAKTDEEGRFWFGQLEAGRYRLILRRPNETGAVQHVPDLGGFDAGATGLTVRARRGLSIRGTVTDKGGAPAAGVYVGARVNGDWSVTKTDADGRFELGGLPDSASCNVTTWREGFVTELRRAVAAGTNDLRLVLRRGLDARGVARDKQGLPLQNRSLRFSWIEDQERRAYAKTDARGRFHVQGLLAGRYRVGAHDPEKGYRPCGELEAGTQDAELRIR